MKNILTLSRSAGLLPIVAALAAAAPVMAQNYPTKPVRLIVPFAPGGSADTLARSMGGHVKVMV